MYQKNGQEEGEKDLAEKDPCVETTYSTVDLFSLEFVVPGGNTSSSFHEKNLKFKELRRKSKKLFRFSVYVAYTVLYVDAVASLERAFCSI